MLSDQQIRDALLASRVVLVAVPNCHGPLGLEQLAEAVARLTASPPSPAGKVERPLTLPADTWAQLDGLARAATKAGSRRVSASDVAAALIERAVAAG